MSRFEKAFGKWVVRWRWWLIVATAVVLGISACGTRFLTFSNDMRVFFSEKNPQLEALQALENTYTKDESVFFAVAPRDGNVFTRDTLAALEELTEASWKMPYSTRVDSITNFQHTRAEGDDLIVEDLVRSAENLSEADLDRIKKIALSEPLLVNRQISPSGNVTGVYVKILLPGKSLEEVPAVAAFARKLKYDLVKKYPGVTVYLSGSVMMDNAFDEVSRDDMATLIPVMVLVLLTIIGLALRSFTGTFATFVIVAVSMVTGMGLAGYLGISLTPASVNAPIIILTLAVADSVHILATMFQRRRQGDSKHDAVSESLRINLQPVFLTSATTAIGFLTMNFSDAPPFRDLGNIVAMGVMAAFFYSVLFLPALMAVLPSRVRRISGKEDCPPCEWLADFVINRRRAVFGGTLAVVALLTAGISRVELNDNWIKYFDDSFEIRRATDFMEENLTGLHQIEYSLESGEAGGINDPGYMETVDTFAEWYRTQPKVVHVDIITETMKRLNKNMHGDDDSYFKIPEQRDLAAQYLLLYEMSLPFGLDLNNRVNVDKSATRMTVTLKDTTTGELRDMDDKARGWLKTYAPESMFTYGSGMSIIWAHISKRNIKSMLGASFLALVLISGILILALQSFKIGLLSLIPNLAPAFMAFGVWGITVGQVGLGLSIIVSMTIGIVVDDTVHFLSKYLRARREYALDPEGAVRFSFNTVGTAMWVTTLAIVSGFVVLTFSGYKMTSDMALMTAITITFALLLDFFFLPVLLIMVDKKKGELIIESKEKIDEKVDYGFDSINDTTPVHLPAVGDSRNS